jgi:hypothetical protein
MVKLKHTIELDCFPGFNRPGNFIDQIIEGTGLPQKEPVSKFFGNWIWDYSEVSKIEWNKIRPILRQRITELYDLKIIRYGSW